MELCQHPQILLAAIVHRPITWSTIILTLRRLRARKPSSVYAYRPQHAPLERMYLVLHAFHALREHTSQPLVNQAARVALQVIILQQLVRLQHVLHPVQLGTTQRLERPHARVAQRDTLRYLPLNQAAQVARQDIIQQRLASHQHALQPVQQAIIQLQERRPAQAVPRDITPQPR